MTDPLPADVREYLESFDETRLAHTSKARNLLAKYPKPAPAWQPGDVAIDNGKVYAYWYDQSWKSPVGEMSLTDLPKDADIIAHRGRRVHPARFHDHAKDLLYLADLIGERHRAPLRRIAKDLMGDPKAPDDFDSEVSE